MNMNDIPIKYIDQALWLKTIEHYPKTVGHTKLLISIVDKMGIFTAFDISTTSEMDTPRLNILYAVLRISNKLYSKYLDHAVKKILVPKLVGIFYENFHKNPSQKQIFIDQFVQDMDHFVSMTVSTCFPMMIPSIIKNKLIEYLKVTFQKDFYKNVMRKMCMHDFYSKHDNVFNQIVNDYITYSCKTLDEPYKTMKNFLELIFNINPNYAKPINDIVASLEKHINLTNLFNEHCMELDVYCEQKLHEEHTTMHICDCHNDKSTIPTAIMNSIGFEIYSFVENSTILKPFVDHKFVKNESELINILSMVLGKYGTNVKFVDNSNLITAREYYAISMTGEHNKYCSYEKFQQNLVTKNRLPKKYPEEMILRIFSRIFGVKIKLIGADLSTTDIHNSEHFNSPIIMIYFDRDRYHTIYHHHEKFVPIGKSLQKTKYLNSIRSAHLVNQFAPLIS